MVENIVVKPIQSEMKEAVYHFKKEKIKDASGAVIGEGKKLPSVKVSVPVPTAEGILEIVQAGGKELEYLLTLVKEGVIAAGRNLVNQIREKSPESEIKPEAIDVSALAWSVIANIPQAERRGLGITDEDWDTFSADYRAIMPKVTGKDTDRIEKHLQHFKKKFYMCRNDKKALGILQDMLNLWASNTSSMEDNEDVYEYLKNRVETLLQEEEKVLAEAL
jgi:hypothetical protein